MNKPTRKSPFSISNVRLFIAFRVFFNSRFYYPVFSILFLDFGLSLSQFAILNSVWAATIVICEVPSGALADSVGRRNLLVFSGALMVLEMSLLAFAPREDANALFLFFLANRILSGMAEASASGADEALAYDSLSREGNASDWSLVLERQMRLQSFGFIVAMVTGAAVYDPSLMQSAIRWAGWDIEVTKDTTLRFPIYLTLVFAVFAFVSALMMKEESGEDCADESGCAKPVLEALKVTVKAGKWILRTPFVLTAILFGLVFDSVVRMVITMSSQYYRIIEIPEAFFGVIGSGIAVMGLFVPGIARRLAENRTPLFNLGVVAILAFAGLIGMTFFFPWFGLLPALLLFSNMYFIGFFMSHYLNRAASSEQRATVLSFKGLSFNLAYGLIGVLYSLLLSFLRSEAGRDQTGLEGEALKNAVFMDSMAWFPWYLAVCFALLCVFAAVRFRK